MAKRGLVASRSQAESWIGLGKVSVDGRVIKKPGVFVNEAADIKLAAKTKGKNKDCVKIHAD